MGRANDAEPRLLKVCFLLCVCECLCSVCFFFLSENSIRRLKHVSRLPNPGPSPPQESRCALHNGGVLYFGLSHSHPAKVGNQHFRLRMLPLLDQKTPPPPPQPPPPLAPPPLSPPLSSLPPSPRSAPASHFTPPASLPLLACVVPTIPRFRLAGHYIRCMQPVAAIMCKWPDFAQ